MSDKKAKAYVKERSYGNTVTKLQRSDSSLDNLLKVRVFLENLVIGGVLVQTHKNNYENREKSSFIKVYLGD